MTKDADGMGMGNTDEKLGATEWWVYELDTAALLEEAWYLEIHAGCLLPEGDPDRCPECRHSLGFYHVILGACCHDDAEDDHDQKPPPGHVPRFCPCAPKWMAAPLCLTGDLATVYQAAKEAFRDSCRALDWLATENPDLDDQTPWQAAATAQGARQVLDLIGRIRHGVY